MSLVKVMGRGQVTIPKKIRDQLGLKEGDYIEAEIAGGKVVMTPAKPVKEEALRKLREVLDRVHAKNPDATEEQVVEDVLKAIEEHRQEEYARAKQA